MPRNRFTCALLVALTLSIGLSSQVLAAPPSQKNGHLRSHAREIADLVARIGLAVENEPLVSVPRTATFRSATGGRANIQVNNPGLNHTQAFPGTRPFEFSIQSETSIAAFGDNILVAYNSSAEQPVLQTVEGFFFIHRFFSAFSVSHDGGKTWSSGFLPPVTGSPFTFGDPSVGVDRAGNFYYASLGTDTAREDTVIVGKSTDGGGTFGPAVVAARDRGSDKEWLAIGPDPGDPSRDNIYVAWTSFKANSSELWLTRSTDGGNTWAARQLFAPVDEGPLGMSAFIQFANPVVDASTGRLYIPFLHGSNFDADFIKVLVSDDGGNSFRFLEFNVPGAPDRFGFPNVTPGTESDCGQGNGGIRPVLHQGPNLGGGRMSLPRYAQATRLLTQPTAAATHGKLFLAFNSSTSPKFGDPASRSMIRLLFSPDGGGTFAPPITAVPASDAEPQHVLPSISVDEQGDQLRIAYYVQQADERIRVDMITGTVSGGNGLDVTGFAHVSAVDFDLIPNNIPLPMANNPFFTTNYDRTVRACYDLGEYLSTTLANGRVLLAWGDNRNPWSSPPGSPAAGTHAQPGVFFDAISD